MPPSVSTVTRSLASQLLLSRVAYSYSLSHIHIGRKVCGCMKVGVELHAWYASGPERLTGLARRETLNEPRWDACTRSGSVKRAHHPFVFDTRDALLVHCIPP